MNSNTLPFDYRALKEKILDIENSPDYLIKKHINLYITSNISLKTGVPEYFVNALHPCKSPYSDVISQIIDGLMNEKS